MRLAHGGMGEWMMGCRWTAYEMARELTADACAASLGQAEVDCQHLRLLQPADVGLRCMMDDDLPPSR
jgi:hypothetical protein